LKKLKACRNDFAIFRIRSKFHSKKRVSECSNKLIEEGYWKDFLKLGSVFKEASKNFAFDLLSNKDIRTLAHKRKVLI
jgi:hypothetical protein